VSIGRNRVRDQVLGGQSSGGRPGGGGLIARDDKPPPKLALAVHLYKSDLVFRSLVDLTLVGLVVLLFAANPFGALLRLPATLFAQAAKSGLHDGISPLVDGQPMQAGRMAMHSFLVPQIEPGTIKAAGEPAGETLRQAQAAIDAKKPEQALALVENLGVDHPAVAYARAVVRLHQPGLGRVTEAQLLLRDAVDKAYAPAFTLMGHALYRLAVQRERNHLLESEMVVVDASRQPRPASVEQLKREAMLWWERGVALGDVAAIRSLGIAQAHGLGGKPNLQAAIAHWRDAASRDDPPSLAELGFLHAIGAGVAEDLPQAVRYLRRAGDARFTPAFPALALALTKSGAQTDKAVAQEAVAVLVHATTLDLPRPDRAAAYDVLAQMLMQVVPPDMRDPPRAVGYWRQALDLGHRPAATALGNAHRLGIGADQDPLRAAAYLRLAGWRMNGWSDPKAQAQAEEIEKSLSDHQRAQVKRMFGTLLKAYERSLANPRPLPSSPDLPTFSTVSKRPAPEPPRAK